MAKRTTAPEPSASIHQSATVDSIDVQLAKLATERTSLLDAEAAIPANERRLHERDAPPAEFLALETQRKRLRFQLEQIDAEEQRLLAAVPDAEAAELRARWTSYVDAFDGLAQQAREQASMLRATAEQIYELHVRAARAGFNPFQARQAVLPTLPATMPWDAFLGLAQGVDGLRRIDPSPWTRAPLYGVRMIEAAVVTAGPNRIGHNKGEIAGFDAKTAWQLVDSGKGVWADARRVPARPAKRINRSAAR